MSAVFFQTAGNDEKAIKAFSRAIESNPRHAYSLFPDHPDANYDPGYIYREKGLYDKALEQYKKALDIDPENIYAHYDIGYIYRKSGPWSGSIDKISWFIL